MLQILTLSTPYIYNQNIWIQVLHFNTQNLELEIYVWTQIGPIF